MIREEARNWIAEHWRGQDDAEWRNALLNAGWAAPTWGLISTDEDSVADARETKKEFEAAGVPGAALDIRPFRDRPWIGLLRDYFPKGVGVANQSPAHLLSVEHELNSRPRMVLQDRCPADLFAALLASNNPSVLRR